MRNTLRSWPSFFGLATLACGGAKDAPPATEADAAPVRIEIPWGSPPTIDGALSPGEWSDAATVGIEVAPGWTVTVHVRHTDADLALAFGPLTGSMECYAEVVVDPRGDRGSRWSDDDWWFHASYNDCEARGRFDEWDCTPTKPGWSANNYPLRDPGTIEMQISYTKLGLLPSARTFGVCFAVATGDDWLPWPKEAVEKQPRTWAKAVLLE